MMDRGILACAALVLMAWPANAWPADAVPYLAVVEKAAGAVGFYSEDGRLLGETKVGSFPHEAVLAPDGRLYVSDNGVLWMTEDKEGTNTISVVDVRSMKTVDRIDLGRFHRPHGIALLPGTNRLLATTERPAGLIVVDPVARKVVRDYDVKGKSPHMVIPLPGGEWAFVSDTDSDAVAAIELRTGNVKLISTGARPQGGVLSPLLANVYMRRFIVAWKKLGHQERFDAHIVNYADDFVICTRGNADEAQARMREIMDRLKLTVNNKKTRRATLPEGAFTFLSYTFCRQYSRRTGAAYLGCRPAVKKIRKLCGDISALTDRRMCLRAVSEIVDKLNRKIRGWANYFCLGPKVRVYAIVMRHARRRLRRWLCAKHKVQDRKHTRYPDRYLHHQLQLLPLDGLAQRLLKAKA